MASRRGRRTDRRSSRSGRPRGMVPCAPPPSASPRARPPPSRDTRPPSGPASVCGSSPGPLPPDIVPAMPHALRTLATGRSWRARLARGGAVLSLGALWMAPTFGWLPPLLLDNTSDSMPEGFYLYAHRVGSPPVARGDVVVVRNPPHFDLPWLMKRVAGVPGDRYCWN